MPQSTRDRVAALAERAKERARDAIREARGPRGDLTLAAIDQLTRQYEAKKDEAARKCVSFGRQAPLRQQRRRRAR